MVSMLPRRPPAEGRPAAAATVEELPAFEEGGCVEEARGRRRDLLPEHTRYMDTGCDLHPSCLTCPLVRCRYDEPGGMRRIASRNRDSSIRQARREERLTVEAIAARFAVSRRTVFRVLARARLEEGEGW